LAEVNRPGLHETLLALERGAPTPRAGKIWLFCIGATRVAKVMREQRRLAAILAVDVVGYSRLMGADEAGTHARFKALRKDLIEPRVAEHQGRIVKLTGDGALVEFASVVDAVQCAVQIQEGMAVRTATVPDHERIVFRIGINLGDVIVDEDDIYGDGVNVAARLEQLADPGGICVSRTVRNQVRDKLPFDFQDLGEHQVKNIARPIRVFRVVPEGATPPVKSNARRNPVRWAALAGTIVLLIAAGGGWWWRYHREPTSDRNAYAQTDPGKPSIAVLPFDNLSPDPKEDYFADGMTEDLITDLSKVSGLLVIARNSVFPYKGRGGDIREVARELGVRYVLEGSVRRAGDEIRINAQLIDSETGGHVWADRFDRGASDLFAVQDEVIHHIVDALAIQLSVREQQRLARLPTANLEAYDDFLRAEQAAQSGFRPQLRKALFLYEKAMALDPTFAEAFAADARTAAYVMHNNYDDVMVGPVARKRAYEHASRALEINPEAPLPFSVLAVLQIVDGLHEEALASAERAVALGPNDAEAHAALSLVLTYSGRHADAVAAIETAMRLNPKLSTSDSVVAGMAFLLNDEPERAIEILERARADAPNVDDIYAMLAAAYAQVGRVDAAHRAAAEAVRVSPNLCVEVYRITLSHFRNDRDLAKILSAMSAGGLPEWPYGFNADSLDRLNAAEIDRLAFGRTWQGRVEGGGPALAQIESDGQLAFRTRTHIATGVAFVAGDLLCERIDALSLGRPMCGPVYRLAKPSDEDELAFAYANASKVFYFSPVQ
jgi:adenylate cyclase